MDQAWQVWLVVVVAAGTAIAAAALAVRARRRASRVRAAASRTHGTHGTYPRRRRGAVWGWSLLSTVAALICAALVVGIQVGYLTSWRSLVSIADAWTNDDPTPVASNTLIDPPTPTSDTAGVVFEETIPSTTTGVPNSVASIYVPPGYSQRPDQTYPVLYLMSGSPGLGSDWFASANLDVLMDQMIAQGQMPPAIIVSPDLDMGTTAEPVDYPGGPQRGTFMTTEVVSWTDTHLRTRPTADQRILGGVSAGAYGAVILGLGQPVQFQGVLSDMPYLVPEAPELADPATTAAVRPLTAIAAAGDLSHRFFYLGIDSDEGTGEVDQISAALQDRGATTKVEVVQGGHDWNSAPALAVRGLPWLAEQLGWLPAGSANATG